jgi:glycosyltransferase involved in cell wall biosynthesis
MEKSRTHIVMVTFNGIEYTRIAIQSLFDNTKTPYNLTIIDNGSTDGTIEYLDSLVLSEYIADFKVIWKNE